MHDCDAPVRAAIDIGSNTIHIVVARCEPYNLAVLADEQEMLRIGEDVNATGVISSQKCAETISTLKSYKALAGRWQAESILVIATEAIRKARNNQDFLKHIYEETGLEVQLIVGEVESALTYYGATYELAQEDGHPELVGVMDIGGGSTELVLARHDQLLWHTSLGVGSGWLHDRYLTNDPPTTDDLEVAQTFLSNYFAGLRIKPLPPMLVATGGSANSLLLLARHAFHVDQDSTHMTRDDVLRCEGLLYAFPADELARRYEQSPKRMRVLPAGALLVRSIMERFRLQEIRISTHGIREGALLAYARYASTWLEQVQYLATNANKGKNSVLIRGAGDSSRDAAPLSREEQTLESFGDSARRLLLESTEKLLSWRDEVLKNKDVEPVHKMRVASRRLRAVLDSYESACEPKQYKKLYREVKQLAEVLGKARDTDVMILNLHARLENAPLEEHAGLQWLIRQLQAYREQYQQTLADYLHKLDENAFKKQVLSCLREGGKG